MKSWTNRGSIALFITLFMCFFLVQSQTVIPRTGHKLNESPGKSYL